MEIYKGFFYVKFVKFDNSILKKIGVFYKVLQSIIK